MTGSLVDSTVATRMAMKAKTNRTRKAPVMKFMRCKYTSEPGLLSPPSPNLHHPLISTDRLAPRCSDISRRRLAGAKAWWRAYPARHR